MSAPAAGGSPATDSGDEAPRASVILCVRNGADDVPDQLRALGEQDIREPWELIVVDNASSDGSGDVVREFVTSFPSLTLVPARDALGLAYARNVGARVARGEVLAFCDADDEVRPGWLRALVRTSRGSALVGGRLCFDGMNDEVAKFWRGPNPTDHHLPVGHHYLPHVVGANFAVHRRVYWEVSGCDERFVSCSDDVDLSWRIQQAGHEVRFAEDAVVDYRLRASVRAVARQQHAYGMSEPLLYRKHRPAMPRASAADVCAAWWYLASRCHHLLRGRMLRGRWIAYLAYRTGRLRGSWRARVWFP